MLLVFDGECRFCQQAASWIKHRLPDRACVKPWQSLDLEKLGLSHQQVTTSIWWLDQHNCDLCGLVTTSNPTGPDMAHQAASNPVSDHTAIGHALSEVHPKPPNPVSGHTAIGHALRAIGGAWGMIGWLIMHAPLARPVYTLIARHRRCITPTRGCDKDSKSS